MKWLALVLVAGCWSAPPPEPPRPTTPPPPPVAEIHPSRVETPPPPQMVADPIASPAIAFAPLSATIEQPSYSDLDQLVPPLQAEADARVLVIAYATELATERAASVAEYLVGKGIANTRLTSEGRSVRSDAESRVEVLLLRAQP